MTQRIYTPEMDALIRELYMTHSNIDIADIINERFPEYGGVTATAIKSYKARNGLNPGRKIISEKSIRRKFSGEMVEFVRQNAKGRTTSELAKMFNAEFGVDVSSGQITSLKQRYKIRSEFHVASQAFLDKAFKKGENMNCCEVGSIRQHNSFLFKKVGMPNKWVELHRLVWEEHNGPIPKGYKIVFLDGNPLNCDISNLSLVTQSEHVYMNHRHLRFKEPEFTQMGVAIAKLAIQTAKREKENK